MSPLANTSSLRSSTTDRPGMIRNQYLKHSMLGLNSSHQAMASNLELPREGKRDGCISSLSSSSLRRLGESWKDTKYETEAVPRDVPREAPRGTPREAQRPAPMAGVPGGDGRVVTVVPATVRLWRCCMSGSFAAGDGAPSDLRLADQPCNAGIRKVAKRSGALCMALPTVPRRTARRSGVLCPDVDARPPFDVLEGSLVEIPIVPRRLVAANSAVAERRREVQAWISGLEAERCAEAC